ncbi:hypothetical protein KM043_009684 [Ampulex compressa]|nr:hypothetical protein KM043_009684 [Ampulex compressa]
MLSFGLSMSLAITMMYLEGTLATPTPSPIDEQSYTSVRPRPGFGLTPDKGPSDASRLPGCPCPRNESTTQPSNWGNREQQLDQGHSRNVLVHGMICSCNLGLRGMPIRDDYRYTPGIGSHKLHTRAATWNAARKICNEEGGHLAVINSVVEAHILMDLFNRSGPVKGAAYPDEALIGIHDLYGEGDWVTVLGDSLAKTGYTRWSDKWGGQPDNGGGWQNCGAFMKEGGLDDVACDVAFPFFCELPIMQFLQ